MHHVTYRLHPLNTHSMYPTTPKYVYLRTQYVQNISLYHIILSLWYKIIYSEVLKWDPKWLFCCGHLTIHFMYSKCHFKTLILVVIIQNNNDNDMICCMVNNITNSSVRIISMDCCVEHFMYFSISGSLAF